MANLITCNSKQIKYFILLRQFSVSSSKFKQKGYCVNSNTMHYNQSLPLLPTLSLLSAEHMKFIIAVNRSFSKKKRTSKFQEELEEESEEEDASENLEADEIGDDYNLITRTVASLRMDSVLKVSLGISKKKIEKDFYACKIRLNGEKILKKASMIGIGDELDLIKGTSPENIRLLLVDRVIIKSVGKLTGNGNYPLTMQVFKALTIENYKDLWVKSSLEEVD